MKPDRCLNGDYLFKEKAAAPTAAAATSGMTVEYGSWSDPGCLP